MFHHTTTSHTALRYAHLVLELVADNVPPADHLSDGEDTVSLDGLFVISSVRQKSEMEHIFGVMIEETNVSVVQLDTQQDSQQHQDRPIRRFVEDPSRIQRLLPGQRLPSMRLPKRKAAWGEPSSRPGRLVDKSKRRPESFGLWVLGNLFISHVLCNRQQKTWHGLSMTDHACMLNRPIEDTTSANA